MNASANNTFFVKDEFELIQSATDYSLERGSDGWISGHAQPARPSAATPTRVPAAIIVTREGVIQ